MFGLPFSRKTIWIRSPNIVLFSGGVETACGNATSDSGPFYCPAKSVYGFVFFWRIKTRFGAQGGDFATAYVIAHEIGHHVQTLLGTSDEMRQMQER
jgi:predicted metalloprotease